MTQHMRDHDQQRTFWIIITAATTARNIRLIVEMIIASHMGISSHVVHNAEGTPPHQGFSLLISVEFACEVQSNIPGRIVLGKMFGGHYLPNRVNAYGPVTKISASVQNPRFFRGQVI